MTKKLLLSLMFFGFAFIGFSGQAKALWPYTSFNLDGSPIGLVMLVENQPGVHDERVHEFSAFIAGDSRGWGGNFQVDTFEITCYPGGSVTITTQSGWVYSPGCAGFGARTATWTSYSSGIWRPELGVTQYRFRVVLNYNGGAGGRQGFHFYVDSPQEPTVKFGNTAGAPFVFIPTGDNRGTMNLGIPQQPHCYANSAGTVASRDYDNYPTSKAQNINNGTDPAFYRRLYVDWRVYGTGSILPNSGSWHYSSPNSSVYVGPWGNAGGNVYYPPDTGSNQYNTIRYSTSILTKYQYVLRDFGNRNFAMINLPFDGVTTPCPQPTATLSARAGGSNVVNTTSGPQNFTFNLWVDASNVSNVGADTFTWRIEKSVNGGAYSTAGVPAPSASPPSISIAGGNPRYSRPITENFNAPMRVCYRIVITGKPTYATYSPQTSPAQCVDVRKDANYYTTVTATDYEKGGLGPTVTYSLFGTPPCGPGTTNQNVIWGGTGLANVTYTNTAVTALPYNCTNRQIGPSIEYKPNPALLDLEPPGPYGSFAGTITSPVVYANTPVAITIYEAPFARFFGNDVKVCGPGSTNRFVFDNRLAATDPSYKKGSFAEYASLYQSANSPSTAYSGLNSAVNNGFPSKLLSNYGSMDCSSGLSTSSTDSDFVAAAPTNLNNLNGSQWNAGDRKVLYISGSTTITQPIIMDNPSPFDPDTHPILLIYATGDINIANNVDRVDAILVSETAINTCTQNSGTGIARSNYHRAMPLGCHIPLAINGAVMAPVINLQRSGGTRYLANTNQLTWKTVGGTNDNTTASEVVNYPWYLNFINIDGLVDRSDTKLDAYFALPPRL